MLCYTWTSEVDLLASRLGRSHRGTILKTKSPRCAGARHATTLLNSLILTLFHVARWIDPGLFLLNKMNSMKEENMRIERLDRFVLTVKNIEETIRF